MISMTNHCAKDNFHAIPQKSDYHGRSVLYRQLSLCEKNISKSTESSGRSSLGTRNTASLFSDDSGPGLGIGEQFRLQITERLNNKCFADYITSKNGSYTAKNHYHIGWSVLFYPGKPRDFSKLLQPYIVAGHCFDYGVVMEQGNPQN